MYKIIVDKSAAKDIKKLDPNIKKRIQKEMLEIANLKNPRQRGKSLTGQYSGLWRYRIGDYRVIVKIKDNELVILILSAIHRSKVYS